ncbi:MAG: M28 family peptidase [Pirellula sp.]
MPLPIFPTSKTLASLALSIAALCFVPMLGSLRADDDPKKALKSPAQERIYADISYLASDDLKGRAAETPGLKLAADFIAKRFGQLGLQTDLFDGQPFQYFEITGNPGASPETNKLELTKPDGTKVQLALADEFQPQAIGSNGQFSAPLVFAGYGITAKEEDFKYDDYEGLDVKGKAVLVIRKQPKPAQATGPFAGTQPSQYAFFTSKESNAASHGAAALILINDAASEKESPGTLLPVAGAGNSPDGDKIPTFFISRSMAEAWLKESGKSLVDIEAAIDQKLEPQSFEMTGWSASGQSDVTRRKIPSMNVLGLLPGQGDLAEQYVIVGAHFDHVGMGGAGSLAPGTYAIHNGADDNASGTVGLLETARQIVEAAKNAPADKPRRSILFMTFSAEELGLIGSEYYVNHPRFELTKTVAMLNLDMVGRLQDNVLTVYGTGTAREFDDLLTRSNEKLGFDIKRQPEGVGPSDHQSFFLKGIPVYHFFSGFHPDYHRPSDDFDKINVEGLSKIVDMVVFLTDSIAHAPERPTFLKSAGTKVRLGVRIKQGEPGLVVERVMPGGWAKKAGVEANDRILKIGQTEVAGREDMDQALQDYKPGDELEVQVQRGEEKIVLKSQIGT